MLMSTDILAVLEKSLNSDLLCLAITLIAGLAMSRLVKLLKLPAVTGYLIAGILIGPYCLGALGRLIGLDGLGFVSSEAVESFDVISQVALGFIAFSIGTEFRLEEIKHIGKQATVIAILQALAATLLVDIVLIGLSFILDELSLEAAIVLGAVAAATAPAATLMVVSSTKQKVLLQTYFCRLSHWMTP